MLPHLIPGVAVQPLLEALLVQRMADQTDGARQHEQAVQVADLDDVLDLRLPTRRSRACVSTRCMQSTAPTSMIAGAVRTEA